MCLDLILCLLLFLRQINCPLPLLRQIHAPLTQSSPKYLLRKCVCVWVSTKLVLLQEEEMMILSISQTVFCGVSW